MGDLDTHLTLFTPNSTGECLCGCRVFSKARETLSRVSRRALKGEAILLADAVIGRPCTTLVAANKGAEVVNLGAATTLGTVIPIREDNIKCDSAARNGGDAGDHTTVHH